MHVAVDCTVVGRQPSGVERAVSGLIEGLAQVGGDGVTLSVLLSAGTGPELPLGAGMRAVRLPRVTASRLGRVCYQQAVLPTLLRSLDVQVLHGPAYVLPVLWDGPAVVTIHDTITLTHPQWCKWANVLHYGEVMTAAALAADVVVVPSEEARRAVIEHLGVEATRTVLAPLGVSERFVPQPPELVRKVRERHGLGERYLLCVGNLEPRKNLLGVIRAFEDIAATVPHDLVLIGKRGWRCGPIFAAMGSSPVAARIRWLGYVPEAELPALYCGADLLVQWSWHEGFGLAPLEAMACGTPAVVSDGGALPEVAGPAARVVPLSAGSGGLAEALLELIAQAELRGELGRQGRQYVGRFTWREHARTMLRAYREAAGEQARA